MDIPKRKYLLLKSNKNQLLIILSSSVIVALSILIMTINKLNKSAPHQYKPQTANSYDECLSRGGQIIKKSKKYETDECVLDGWYYPWSPTKAPVVDYTFELEDNEFITFYNQVNPLSFTLNMPSQCKILNINEPLYKNIECNYDSQKIALKPTEGGRHGPSEPRKEIISNKIVYGGYEWESVLYIFTDLEASATYSLIHPETNDYYVMRVNYEKYSDNSANFVDRILSTMNFGEKVNRTIVY